MLFNFRRKEVPWEVVDNSIVEPVSMVNESEDLYISRIGENNTVGTYVFDIRGTQDFRRALAFSRKLLLQEMAKRGFNILLVESWRLTILRKGRHHRVEIRYGGRPARAFGKVPYKTLPPFINILDRHTLTAQ